MNKTWRQQIVIIAPFLWLIVFVLVPILIVFKISIAESIVGMPPYAPLIEKSASGWQSHLSLSSYGLLASDALYAKAYLTSIKIAGLSTLFCLLLGYPLAYGISRAPKSWHDTLVLLVILPFWTSSLIRVYACIGILNHNGVINSVLMWLGVIHEPLSLLDNAFAVYVGLTYSYLPFMVLPLYVQLEKLDPTLLEAAANLGCRPWQAFWRITWPLSIPGIVSGSFLVFIPAVGEYVIPELLGGPRTLMIGKVLWNEFFNNRDWPMASVVAIVMLALLLLPMGLVRRLRQGESI